MCRKYSTSLILFALFGLLFLNACTLGVQTERKESFVPRTRPQTVFVVPFTTIMVPPGVAEGLFDRFVDTLNAGQSQGDLEYIILKQGIDKIDSTWLAQRDYVTGEVFAYVEEMGSSMVSIRAKSRIQLYQPGQTEATLTLEYPVEVFYEKDYSTLEDARRKLAIKLSDSMAQKLKEALAGN